MADELVSVPILRAWDEGPRLRALVLDLAGSGLASKFTVPGQYVRAKAPGAPKEAFLAIASAPGAPTIELLVQRTGEPTPAAADRIADLREGDRVEISSPGGKGFAVDAARGHGVLALAGGSGISAIRSVVEHVALHRDDFRRVVFLVGARTKNDLAYRGLFDRWRDARIEVDATLSRPEDPNWTGRTGYVTAVLEDLSLDAADTFAFLAGGKPFCQATTEALVGLGVPPERVSLNF